MNKETRSSIKKMVQTIRGILMQEAREQLEGIYGLHGNGTFEDIKSLPELKDADKAETRRQLEYFLNEEKKTDLKCKDAVDKLVKEIAFTHLNRFVAFKMMEARKIIRETVSRDKDSNAFKFYLVDHPDDEKLFNTGSSDEAYEHFILWQSGQIEIKVLFDADNLPSRIFPRPRVLKEVLGIINGDEIASVWQEDETIGWVYQYFIEEDKDAVFEKIYKQKKKMELRDIPAATQIFTPKWIVQYLVENTLGRLWLRIHPDSKLKEHMKYYVPNEQDKDSIPFKRVRDITLLDPACGTMHFGMTAFDIFYTMYLEEIENAGKEGWGEEPSVKNESDIPKSIIENNLYGIDLDLRAIQLSALSLYIKAKGRNKDTRLERFNLTYTDIPPFSDEAINNFLYSLPTAQTVTKKLLREILPVLNKAYYLGSLLKIEAIINDFIEKEKIVPKGLKAQTSLFEERGAKKQLDLDLYVKKKVAWDQVKEEILPAFKQFAESHKETSGSFLANESIKGMGLIDALIRKHDVVVCNPPYSGRRNMNEAIRNELKNLYPNKDGDLYTVFIDRCLDLTTENYGFCGMVTIHSFMFTSSHEEIRREIINGTEIEGMVHLGTRAEFDVANKTAQGFTMYSLGRISNSTKHSVSGVYFRLVKENEEEKHIAFREALNNYRNNPDSFSDPHVFVLQQEKLKAIPGHPLFYFISDNFRNLFSKFDKVKDLSCPCRGDQLSDNIRFIRYFWEMNKENIFMNCSDHKSSMVSNKTWYPYMKGGAFNKWYGNHDYLVNWKNDGKEVLNLRPKSVIRNYEEKFKHGITFSSLTIGEISFRLMEQGFLFDQAGSAIIPKEISIYLLMGILNSKLATYIIKLVCPTVNYTIGDIAKIPVAYFKTKNDLQSQIKTNVQLCISLKKSITEVEDTNWYFICPANWHSGLCNILKHQKELANLETTISELVYELYDIDKTDIYKIELEFNILPAKLPKVNDLKDPQLQAIETLYLEKHVPEDVITQNSQNMDDEDAAGDEGGEDESSTGRGRLKRFLTFEELCLASGFHPETVYDYIVENKLEREEERYELAVSWISYALGVVLGRFKPGQKGELGCGIDEDGTVFLVCDFVKLGKLIDDDGIMVLDKGHPDDLPSRIEDALFIMFGESDAKSVINTIGGDLRSFLEKDFFIKWHIPQYKKRPVYWLLQSSKKSYGLYVFHERLKADSIYSIQEKYINPKIVLEKSHLAEHKGRLETLNEGKEKRNLEKEIDKLEAFIDELIDFQAKVKAIADKGYDPDIDDGVILNMAPLYEIIPWAEPKKFWKELKDGKYDWAHMAMKYWPDRVKKQCSTNKSLAIAHGLEK